MWLIRLIDRYPLHFAVPVGVMLLVYAWIWGK